MSDDLLEKERRITRIEQIVSGCPTQSDLSRVREQSSQYADKLVERAMAGVTSAMENQFKLSHHATKEIVGDALRRHQERMDIVRESERKKESEERAREREAERLATEERVRQEVARQVGAGWKLVVGAGSLFAILFMGVNAGTARSVSGVVDSIPVFGR